MTNNSVFIYIKCFDKLEAYKIKRKCIAKEKSQALSVAGTNLKEIESDGIDFHYFLKELQLESFRRKLYNILRSKKINLFIKIIPPDKQPLDYRWNEITLTTVWEKVETDHLISWLSTLGGGFSALGDNITACAEIAGKISLRQLEIGFRLGDPFLQSRCYLFFSISLIQTNKLRRAKKIIRCQYKFAKQHEESDKRLVKMCQGVWLKLQYSYYLRNQSKKTNNYSTIA